MGCATAALLAEAGATVTLYERQDIASGASGRNSGVVQQPFDRILARLYRETLTLYRTLAARPEAAFAFPDDPAGLLLVSTDAAAIGRLTDEIRTSDPELLPEIVEGPALVALEPALAGDLAACRLPIGFPVGPADATHAFARLAEARGAIIETGTRAWIAIEAGRAVGVRIEDSLRPAEAVVVTAGPWSSEVIDPAGRWRPIRPIWGVVISLELPDPPRHVLEEAGIDIEPDDGAELADLAGPSEGAPPEGPGSDDAHDFSLVTAAGTSALGSTFLDHEPEGEAWVDRLIRRGARFVPGIASARRTGVRVCARPIASDGRPLIGAVPGIAGAYVSAGHGPWGISTGPASARMVADLVLGRSPEIPAACDPARFAKPRR